MFEGHGFNTRHKLRRNQVKYDVMIPMAHAAGDPDGDGVPKIMREYRTGGTPWTVIIDPGGRVAYNDFHIKVDRAIQLIEFMAEKID